MTESQSPLCDRANYSYYQPHGSLYRKHVGGFLCEGVREGIVFRFCLSQGWGQALALSCAQKTLQNTETLATQANHMVNTFCDVKLFFTPHKLRTWNAELWQATTRISWTCPPPPRGSRKSPVWIGLTWLLFVFSNRKSSYEK